MMSITDLRATRLGSHALRYLSEQVRTGTVVSTFRHGFNVLFNEGFDPGFVSFQTEEVPLHPWAVEMTSVPRSLAVEMSCSVETSLIRFDNELSIDIADADVRKLQIEPYTKREAERALLRLPLLEQLLEEEAAKHKQDPFQPQIDALLEQWKRIGNPEALLDLVGLGSGSTPSGDDVLVGILAGFVAFEGGNLEGERLLNSLRGKPHRKRIQERTHPASAQMIDAALDTAFPEPICHLLHALKQSALCSQLHSAVAGLLSLGSSSGVAMLSGLIASSVSITKQH